MLFDARIEAGVPLLISIHVDEGDALVLIVLFFDTLKKTEYKRLLRAVLTTGPRAVPVLRSALSPGAN